MKNLNTSSDLKNELHSLAIARQGIEKATDVSGSMVKLHKTLNNIKPLLQNQETYIKNFFNSQESSSTENKQSENRRNLNRICQLAINDINDMLDVSENYFCLDFKNSWGKVKNSYEKELNSLKQSLDPKNTIEFLFKIINLKDFFIAQFMKSLLYRKSVLWRDLNINESEFIHNEHQLVLNKIDQDKISRGYIPTKPFFPQPNFNVKMNWNMNKLDTPQSNLKSLLELGNEAVESIMSVVRNYGSLTEKQRESQDIQRNQDKVKSLREEIENAKISCLIMQKKYRDALLKDEKSDLMEMREKVSKMQEKLESTQNQLKRVKFQFRDSSNQIKSLQQKIKELESDLNRVTNTQMKKLKQLETVQVTLLDEFTKIYKNISNFGSMFEFESDDKKSLAIEISKHLSTIDKLAGMLGKQKNKNKDMQDEIVRLNLIILELGKMNQLRETQNEKLHETIIQENEKEVEE